MLCVYIVFFNNTYQCLFFNPPPRSGEGIIGIHFYRASVCPSVSFRVSFITYVCIDGLPSNLVQMLTSLRQCAVILTRINTRSKSHKNFKGQSTHARVRAITYAYIDGLPSNFFTSGTVQRTSQVEGKNNGGGYSRPLDCLVGRKF